MHKISGAGRDLWGLSSTTKQSTRTGCSGPSSNWVLSICNDGHSKTSLGNSFNHPYCFSYLDKLCYISVCAHHLSFRREAPLRSIWLCLLYIPIKSIYLYISARHTHTPWTLSHPCWTIPALSAFPDVHWEAQDWTQLSRRGLNSAEQKWRTCSLDLLAVLCPMPPGDSFPHFKVHCWFTVSLMSIMTPRSSSASRLHSSLYWSMGLFLPRCSARHFLLLNCWPWRDCCHFPRLSKLLWNSSACYLATCAALKNTYLLLWSSTGMEK